MATVDRKKGCAVDGFSSAVQARLPGAASTSTIGAYEKVELSEVKL